MNIIIGTIVIWAGVIFAWRRLGHSQQQQEALARSVDLLKYTLPRIAIALLGAGLFAELLPQDQVRSVLGKEAGFGAILLASILGPITPGGAFVSFAIGAGALKAGAAIAPVMAYTTAWALFSTTKILAYELPLLGGRNFMLRFAVTWPLPLLVGGIAYFLPV